MKKNQPLSIVVPTLNEVGNIPSLLSRIHSTLHKARITYEVIIIDDHSTDGTIAAAKKLAHMYPVKTFLKSGMRGKAHSLLEGFKKAEHELVVMIDADLQYPPEKIAPMYQLMQDTKADVIVTKRIQKDVSAIRQISTKTFNLIFARMLFGIRFDTQSGLKLFKKRILSKFTMNPSPWSFDMEFLVRSLENKYKIASLDIPFEERTSGSTKVRLLSTTFALAKASLILRWKTSTSKLRAGDRANNMFLKRALQRTSMMVVLASSLFTVTAAPKADALSINPSSLTTSSSLISDVLDPITKLFETKELAKDAEKPTTTIHQNTNPTPTAPAPTETTPTAATSTTTSSPEETQPATTSAVAAASNTRQAAQIPLVEPDKTGLSAATAVQASSVYDTGYPDYALSSQSTNRLLDISKLALIAGGVSLGAAALFLGASKLRLYTKRIQLRS